MTCAGFGCHCEPAKGGRGNLIGKSSVKRCAILLSFLFRTGDTSVQCTVGPRHAAFSYRIAGRHNVLPALRRTSRPCGLCPYPPPGPFLGRRRVPDRPARFHLLLASSQLLSAKRLWFDPDNTRLPISRPRCRARTLHFGLTKKNMFLSTSLKVS